MRNGDAIARLSTCGTAQQSAEAEGQEVLLKSAAATLIFLLSIAAAAVPMWLGKTSAHAHSTTIHYGNAFSAGVFLAMGLLHLLPEAGHSLRAALGEESVERFHIDYALCICGYTLIMTLQRVVFRTPTCPTHFDTHDDGEADESAHGHSHGDDDLGHTHGGGDTELAALKELDQVHPATYGTFHTHDHHDPRVSPQQIHHQHHLDEVMPTCDSHMHCEGVAHLLLDRNERIAAKQSLGLMLALSLHALGEGVALGLQCGPENIYLFTGAVLAHKWAESFALSANLVAQGGSTRQALQLVLAFSLSAPAGVIAAMLTKSSVPLSTAGGIKAVSAGTLLYIGASEVVVEEFVQGKQYWAKWFFYLCGLGLIYAFSIRS